jgi:hypothetical protein
MTTPKASTPRQRVRSGELFNHKFTLPSTDHRQVAIRVKLGK